MEESEDIEDTLDKVADNVEDIQDEVEDIEDTLEDMQDMLEVSKILFKISVYDLPSMICIRRHAITHSINPRAHPRRWVAARAVRVVRSAVLTPTCQAVRLRYILTSMK